MESATPGKGLLTYDEGFDKTEFSEESDFAEWLFNEYGGNIQVKKIVEEQHRKNPDFVWNGALWELKSPKSEKGVNSALKKGLQQIAKKPGGVMLEFHQSNLDMLKLQNTIDKRMQWVHDKTVDIMIVNNKKTVKILRYEK